MRKLLIAADMEGCAAVSSPNALGPERWPWEWAVARKWMTGEVLGACDAAFATGFEGVVVADGHGNAHNIDPDLLPDNVQLVRSWPRPLLHMQGIEDKEVEVCGFVGYHAGSDAPGSILAHTYSGAAFRAIHLNGEACSEGYLNAALAGEFVKPVVFVSGDRATIEDAKRYAPNAIHVVSKESIGILSAMSLPPHQVRAQIAEGMREALTRPRPAPFVLSGPFRLDLEMTTQAAAEMLAFLPHVLRSGAYAVSVRFESIAAVVRFVAFAMLYTPTGKPAL